MFKEIAAAGLVGAGTILSREAISVNAGGCEPDVPGRQLILETDDYRIWQLVTCEGDSTNSFRLESKTKFLGLIRTSEGVWKAMQLVVSKCKANIAPDGPLFITDSVEMIAQSNSCLDGVRG